MHCVELSLVSHLFAGQGDSRGRAGGRRCHGGGCCCRGGRRGRVLGDAPRGPGHGAAAAEVVFGGAALAGSCRLAGVEGAQGLGLVGLTLPVQQFIQDLRRKEQM